MLPLMTRTLALCLLLLLPAAGAWAGSLTLVLVDTTAPYTEFSRAMADGLDNGKWKLRVVNRADALEPADLRADLIVTAGADAFRQTLPRAGNVPIIATLLPRLSYDRILAEAGANRGRTTAIVLDQPPQRLAAFVRHLLPNRRQVGTLFSPETRTLSSVFRQSLAGSGLSLREEDSDGESTLLPTLNTLLPKVDVLLALPDANIYRRDNIKAILISAYRQQKPVIAYSTAFVNAGALAAIYSTPAQIAHQTAELVNQSGSTLPAPMHPNLFAIAINTSVAQAMDLNLPDETSLRRAMLGEGSGK